MSLILDESMKDLGVPMGREGKTRSRIWLFKQKEHEEVSLSLLGSHFLHVRTSPASSIYLVEQVPACRAAGTY